MDDEASPQDVACKERREERNEITKGLEHGLSRYSWSHGSSNRF